MVPGATAMQTAADVGLRVRGVAGAAVCFGGFGLPAFCLMLFFAAMYAQTGSLPAIVAAFSGLQAVVVAIVANATLSFGKTTLKHWKHFLIAAGAAVCFWLNVHPFVVILLAATGGWLLLPPSAAADLRPGQPAANPVYKRSIQILLAVAAASLVVLYLFSMDLFNLALLMMRVDLMAFGGGFASVPLLYHEVVEVNNWLSGPTFMNGIILGQATPGPVVITATFIGYLLHGVLGAVIATVFIFLPSFMLVVGLSPFFNRLNGSPLFSKIIRGVLCSFVGLLLSVSVRFGLQIQWDLMRALLAAGALGALLRKVDILWVVLVGTALSVALLR
jgi:chromate transporter